MAPPPVPVADNYKTVAAVISQLDISKAGIDWKKVATDIGITNPNTARQRWQNILKLGGGASALAGSRKIAVSAKEAPKATKRKASKTGGKERAEAEAENEEGNSAEEVGKGKGGKGKQTKGGGVKRMKLEAGDDKKFENGNRAEEYHQDGGQVEQDGDDQVLQWLNHQVAPGEEEDDYAGQQYDLYYDDAYPQI